MILSLFKDLPARPSLPCLNSGCIFRKIRTCWGRIPSSELQSFAFFLCLRHHFLSSLKSDFSKSFKSGRTRMRSQRQSSLFLASWFPTEGEEAMVRDETKLVQMCWEHSLVKQRFRRYSLRTMRISPPNSLLAEAISDQRTTMRWHKTLRRGEVCLPRAPWLRGCLWREPEEDDTDYGSSPDLPLSYSPLHSFPPRPRQPSPGSPHLQFPFPSPTSSDYGSFPSSQPPGPTLCDFPKSCRAFTPLKQTTSRASTEGFRLSFRSLICDWVVEVQTGEDK